jgi:Na+/proline symporter
VGLCAVVLYPQLPVEEGAKGFVYAMKDYLPTGLLGLLFAAFLAAYMSTISTQLNWGVSYLVADLYKPYLLPNRSERHYVAMSRIATVGLMLVSLIITLNLDSISSAWTFLIDTGAGLGLVLILRWYWWRVNSWSEIAAMLLPLLLLPLLKLCMPNEGFWGDRTHFVWLFAATTVVWLVVTLLTPPEPRNHLLAFAQRVRPQGFWKPIWVPAPDAMPATPLYILALAWLSGCGMVYGLLIGVGGLLLSQSESLGIGFGAALLSALVLVFLSRKWKLL